MATHKSAEQSASSVTTKLGQIVALPSDGYILNFWILCHSARLPSAVKGVGTT